MHNLVLLFSNFKVIYTSYLSFRFKDCSQLEELYSNATKACTFLRDC